MEKKIKILVASNIPIAVFGFEMLLVKQPDLEFCGEAGTLGGALKMIESKRPDLLMIGLPLDGRTHCSVVEAIRAKYAGLIIHAAIRQNDPALAKQIIQAGANACIHKGESLAGIIESIRAVLRGEVHVGSGMAKQIVRRALDGKSTGKNMVDILSRRELDVFSMLGQGATLQHIATTLDLSTRTIESHRKNIKMKLGLKNANQLNSQAFYWWSENN
jgi:DNA-binding NarL/FixJ family response regulator